MRFLLLFVVLISFETWAKKLTLFEAYSRILSGGQHIGFVIQRYQFDNNKKQYLSTYYLRTKSGGVDVTESLNAIASEKLKPLAFTSTLVKGAQSQIVKGQVSGNVMTVVKKINGQESTSQVNVPSDAFFGTFLNYVLLKSPEGLKVDKKHRRQYKAIAEEDGTVHTGFAWIKAEEDYKGTRVFKIYNEFRGSRYIFWVTPKGETLRTSAPVANLSTEVVTSPAQATQGFKVSPKNLKLVFGTIPTGKVHPLRESKAQKRPQPNTLPITPPPGKKLPNKGN